MDKKQVLCDDSDSTPGKKVSNVNGKAAGAQELNSKARTCLVFPWKNLRQTLKIKMTKGPYYGSDRED